MESCLQPCAGEPGIQPCQLDVTPVYVRSGQGLDPDGFTAQVVIPSAVSTAGLLACLGLMWLVTGGSPLAMVVGMTVGALAGAAVGFCVAREG